jgi:proton glutamate symport protein
MSSSVPAHPRLNRRLPLHLQILVALAISALLGVFFDDTTRVFGVSLANILGFLGDMFLRALKMLVIPLIASSIIVGVASSGGGNQMGKLGLQTAIYYLVTSLVAILIGLVLVVTIQPGTIDGQPVRELVGLSADVSEVTARVEGRGASDVVGVFRRMIPENVVAEAARGEMLGVIVFSLLFGFFATKIATGPHEVLINFWQGVYEVMLKMTDFVLLFAPIGVLGLVGKVALTTGASAIIPLLSFVMTVLVALSVHAFVFVPLVLLLIARVNPRTHFRLMAPALLMALSTASSSGTLPLTMERVRLLGVPQRVSSFTLPLGATVNMDGTALYECVAAVFIAQAYGVQLDFPQLLLVVVIALFTSVGVAGIPAASLVAISIILTSMGLPLEGLGLILAVDRVLDMCRTSVNVLGDSAAAVVVSHLQGDPLARTQGEVAVNASSPRAAQK